MSVAATKIIEWTAFGAAVIGGGTWVGSIDTQVDNNVDRLEALQPLATGVAVDIATLKERTEHMERDLRDVRDQQKEILDELRKK